MSGFLSVEVSKCDHDNFLIEISTVDAVKTVASLNNQSTRHAFSKQDIFHESHIDKVVFLSGDHYKSGTFRSIIPETGASGISMAGVSQLPAL